MLMAYSPYRGKEGEEGIYHTEYGSQPQPHGFMWAHKINIWQHSKARFCEILEMCKVLINSKYLEDQGK